MKKIDIRVRKTQKIIKDSFIELIEIKGYNNVTVSDICKLADINRNTFYLHYQDKEDLIEKLVLEATTELNEALGTVEFLKHSTLANISEIEIRWGFRNLLRHIEPNIEFFRILLLDSSIMGYVNKMFDTIKRLIGDALKVKNPLSNLVFEYTLSGMIGLIKQWILYSPADEKSVSKILGHLAYNNLQSFKEIN